ncbi:hypothetical protein DRN44_00155 [Thermococci archaeon]|nr:MAG: hypothetical protein DRN44_00155 [Thermococci archaeon]
MNRQNKYLSVLLAVLMLATALPGFFAPVTAATSPATNIVITDGNEDGVILLGENITIEFDSPYSKLAAINITYTNTTSDTTSISLLNDATATYDEATGTWHYVIEFSTTEKLKNISVTEPAYLIVQDNFDGQSIREFYVNTLQLIELTSGITGGAVNNTQLPGNLTGGIRVNTKDMLVGDSLVVVLNITGSAPYVVKKNANINIDGVTFEVNGNDTTETLYNLTATVTIEKVDQAFDVTSGAFVLGTINTNAKKVIVDQDPHGDFDVEALTNTVYDPDVRAYTAGTPMLFNATIWANITSVEPYEVFITLPSGFKFNTTNAKYNKTIFNVSSDNTTLIMDLSADENGTVLMNVTIPDTAEGMCYVTVKLNGSTVTYEWPLAYVLPKDTEASVSANQSTVYLGVEDLRIDFVVTNDTAKSYNITLVSVGTGKDVAVINSSSKLVSKIPQSWVFETSNLSKWPSSLSPGEYEVRIYFFNDSDETIANATSDPVTFIDEIEVTELSSVYNKYHGFKDDKIYPGDDIFVNVTVTHGGTYNFTLGDFTNASVPVTHYNAKSGYIAVNLSDIFTNFNLSNGTYTLVVSDGITNITKDFKVMPHNVTLSKDSASIWLGFNTTIQVTTTSPDDIKIVPNNTVLGMVNITAFNESTHTKMWNVTFGTDDPTKAGKYEINITVSSAESVTSPATFTLEVKDDLTIMKYTPKLVLGDTLVILAQTHSNISNANYKLKFVGAGATWKASPPVVGVYNDTFGYKNLTIEIDPSANAPDTWLPFKLPLDVNLTDGYAWDKVEVEMLNDTMTEVTNLKDGDTIYLGQKLKIEGYTYVTPGEKKIDLIFRVLNQSNLTEVIDSYSYYANVTWEQGEDGRYYFVGYIPLYERAELTKGVHNITVNDTIAKYGRTINIQVNVESGVNVTTELPEYYPDGKMLIKGKVNGASGGTVNISIVWKGDSESITSVPVKEDGTFEYNYSMTKLAGYVGDVWITAEYNGVKSPEWTVSITDKPDLQKPTPENLEKVTVGGEELYGVKLGEGLFNITAQSNLGIDAEVTLKILNETKKPVFTKTVYVEEKGLIKELVNMTNETKYQVGKYYIVLEYTDGIKTNSTNTTVYVWKQGYNVTVKNVTFDVPEETVVPFTVAVNVTLENTGDLDAIDYPVTVFLDGKVANSTPVTIKVGEEKSVILNVEITEAGEHVIKVDGFNVTVNATEKLHVTIDEYDDRVQAAENVYITFKDYTSMDYLVSVPYITPTLSGVAPKFKFAENFVSELGNLTANDVVISIGGPLVNDVTAYYEDIAPVHMVVGENITIVTLEGNFTWTPPKPWWNATEGYFIIQLFEDPDTSALVVTIYGTDMDSTAAGAYYFANTIYPNLDSYSGVNYIVGLWEDTEAGADYELPGASLGDTSGFSSGDSITPVAQG